MSTSVPSRWSIAIDRGGTFTDVVAWNCTEVRQAKVLSSQGVAGEDAAVDGIRRVLELDANTPLDSDLLEVVRVGTTVATNALLTRTGDDVVLVVTEGFRDLPVIGNQSRPDLFALDIQRSLPVATHVVEARARVAVDGQVIQPLDKAAALVDLTAAYERGYRSVAITLLHGWQHGEHEEQIAKIARSIGFCEIVTSRMCPLRGVVSRIDTTSLDASLTPVVHAAMSRLVESIGDTPVVCMQSNGGLIQAESFRGSAAVLSGPAGGVVAAASVAARQGIDRVIAMDMGGTSTDVSWYAGELERCTDTVVGGVRVRSSMLRIHTVAAGGGSICYVSGGRYRVGPSSAGSTPGPACYGMDGPATLTDCHVLLGRLPVEAPPPVFGPSGDAVIDAAAAHKAINVFAGEASPEQVADGFLMVAVERIASAIREVSVEQGHDPAAAALCVFGGASGGVACRVADRLGMDTVIIPPRSGVLSAVGIAQSRRVVVKRESIERTLDRDGLAETIGVVRRLCVAAHDELRTDRSADVHDRVRVSLRAAGWDRSLDVPLDELDVMDQAFRTQSRDRFGFEARGPLTLDAVEVEASIGGASCDLGTQRGPDVASRWTSMWVDGEWRDVLLVDESYAEVITGPAVVLHDGATTVIEPGWNSRRCEDGTLRVQRISARPPMHFSAANLAHLEIMNRRLLSICRDMGTTLQHIASSVNMKERLDYSCAIFDEVGRLVANGPHIPVHLGSMGQAVRRVLQKCRGTLEPGAAFLINDPAQGGTHLPDLTVVSPVLRSGRVVCVVASRAHHADVGGTTPGSMPPHSVTLAQEGVVFDAMPLTLNSVLQEDALRETLGRGPWPARQPDMVVDDVRAQIAANRRGIKQILAMSTELGYEGFAVAMRAMRENASACVLEALQHVPDGQSHMVMDDGGEVCVRVVNQGGRTTIDFTGTSGQREGNTNAPRAVTTAAVLYVLRCLVADDIPLNEGCLDAIKLVIPENSMLSPGTDAAVVGGNVETSQIIVDCLLAAFGCQAASQGTMNNLTFGTNVLQYYETLCGGAGGGPGFDGASAVHTHMTNSLLTDPEVLEARFPVRLEHFGIRPNSGGAGAYRGGDGAIRAIRFLKPMAVSLLAGRRAVRPPGLNGGADGQAGSQSVTRADGSHAEFDGRCTLDVGPGDLIEIRTPGGGGFGSAAL